MLDDDTRRLVAAQGLGLVATVRPDGAPNLSPKETTEVWDDEHLVLPDLHPPGTVADLAGNPAVETNAVDPVRRKGYRFRGVGGVFTEGEPYDRIIRRFERKRGTDPARVNSTVLVRVPGSEPLVSPAHEDGAMEEETAARRRARPASGTDATGDGQGEPG